MSVAPAPFRSADFRLGDGQAERQATMEGGIEGGSMSSRADPDPQRTYAKVLARREAQLAKEAITERRCVQITKRFLKDQEDATQEHLDHLKAASQKNHERMLDQVKTGEEAQKMLREELRLEKDQIRALMKEKALEREAKEQKENDEVARRYELMQKRVCYEGIESENRRKKVDEAAKERSDKAQERKKKNEMHHEEETQRRQEELSVVAAKVKKNADGASDRKRQEDAAKRRKAGEDVSDWQTKLKHADEKKRNMSEDLVRRGQEAQAKRDRKVAELRAKEESEQQERHMKVKDRASSLHQRGAGRYGVFGDEDNCSSATDARPGTEETPAARRTIVNPAEHAVAGRLAASNLVAATTPPSPRHGAARTKVEEKTFTYVPSLSAALEPTPWKEELTRASRHTSVQKEYVTSSDAMEDAKRRMLTRKTYKSLAEGAKESSDGDLQTRRLRFVHTQLSRSARAKESGEKAASVPASARTQRTPRRALGRMQPCALCDKEFPVELLEGSAFAKTVDKLRQRSPHAARRPQLRPERKSDAPPGGGAGPAAATELPTPRGDREEKLYDHRVKLCSTCLAFVRVVSS